MSNIANVIFKLLRFNIFDSNNNFFV